MNSSFPIHIILYHLIFITSSVQIAVAIAAYSLCSSTLLLANKLSLHYIPMPATTSLIQLAFAAVVVLLLKYVMKQDIDGFEWEKVRPYLYYVAIFVAAIYSNMQALSHSNVETVIVFRACSPIAVCAIEYFFMNRELPSTRSAASLLCVAVGAIVYCMSDSDFALKGLSAYYWVFIYFITIVLEMTYGKILTSSVKTVSVWAPVLYCNLFAVPPMFLLGLSEGGFNGVASALPNLGFAGFVVIAFSCVVGTLIG